jgi:hypothetical protein
MTSAEAVQRLRKTYEIYGEANDKFLAGQLPESALPKLHANFARVLDETERVLRTDDTPLSQEDARTVQDAIFTFSLLVIGLRMGAMVADGEPRPRQILLEEAQRQSDMARTRNAT